MSDPTTTLGMEGTAPMAAPRQRAARLLDRMTLGLGSLSGLAAFTLAAIYLLFTRTQGLRLNWGDPWSDANVQASGKFFTKVGFVRLAFTPIIDIEPLSSKPLRYTHYPPLPDVVNGLQQALFGPLDLAEYRFLAIGLSLASLIVFRAMLRRMSDVTTANLSTLFLSVSFLWLQYADTIHHIPILWFFGFSAITFALLFLDEQISRRRLLYLGGTFIASFVCFSASYDFLFFVPIVSFLAAALHQRKLLTRSTLLIGATIVAAGTAVQIVKSGLIIWAIGKDAFIKDFLFQFHERATSKYSQDYRFGFLPILAYRTWRYFGPLFVLVVAAFAGTLAKLSFRGGVERSRIALFREAVPVVPLVFLAAAIPFISLFSQLFCEQQHPTLLLLPFYAVTSGFFVARCLTAGGTRRLLGLGYFAGTMVWQLHHVYFFPKEFLDRSDIQRVTEWLSTNDQRRFILMNNSVDAPVRTYWNRYPFSLPSSTLSPNLHALKKTFDTFGGDQVTYVYFHRAERIAFDKMLFGHFGSQHKWSWIGNPEANVDEWMPALGMREAELLSCLARLGTMELRGKGLTVYRLRRETLAQIEREKILDAKATFLDFGEDAFEIYRQGGFEMAENLDGGIGHSWSEVRAKKEIYFTLHGLEFSPTTEPRHLSEISMYIPPEHDARIRLSMLSAVRHSEVRIRANDTPIGSVRFEGDLGPKLATIAVPRSALAESGLQRLSFEYDLVDAKGHNFAIEYLRLLEPLAPR